MKKCPHCKQPFHPEVIRKNKQGGLTIKRTRHNLCERCMNIQTLRRARWRLYYSSRGAVLK
jgi:hypothetical protein